MSMQQGASANDTFTCLRSTLLNCVLDYQYLQITKKNWIEHNVYIRHRWFSQDRILDSLSFWSLGKTQGVVWGHLGLNILNSQCLTLFWRLHTEDLMFDYIVWVWFTAIMWITIFLFILFVSHDAITVCIHWNHTDPPNFPRICLALGIITPMFDFITIWVELHWLQMTTFLCCFDCARFLDSSLFWPRLQTISVQTQKAVWFPCDRGLDYTQAFIFDQGFDFACDT